MICLIFLLRRFVGLKIKFGGDMLRDLHRWRTVFGCVYVVLAKAKQS